MNEIISLKEDGSEPRLSNWVIFEIEFVKSVERVRVGLKTRIIISTVIT